MSLIYQDVQYHNNIEITSVVLGGECLFRAYSLFQAAVPDLDLKRRCDLITKISRHAGPGAVLAKRYKSSNAWFFSVGHMIRAGAAMQHKLANGDRRTTRFAGRMQEDLDALGLACGLAQQLELMPKGSTPWPVEIQG